MSKQTRCALILVACCWSGVPFRASAETMSYVTFATSGYSFGNNELVVTKTPYDWHDLSDERARYQTFVLTEPRRVSRVDVKIRKAFGTDFGKVLMYIVPWANDAPSLQWGTPVGWPVDPANVGATWTVVSFSVDRDFQPGEYAVVLAQQGGFGKYEWAASPGYVNLHWGKYVSSRDYIKHVDKSYYVDERPNMGWMQISAAGRDGETIDISHSGTAGALLTAANPRFQTFITTSSSKKILGVDVKVRSTAWTPGSGELVMELYNTWADVPAGDPIASATIPAPCTAYGWNVVHAPLRYNGLVSDRAYAIVLRPRNRTSWAVNAYEWAIAPTHDALHFGKWDGSRWTKESARGDGWMRIWGDQETAVVDIRNTATNGYGFGNASDEIKRFQVVNLAAHRGKSISGVDLKLRKYSGPVTNVVYPSPSDITVELYVAVNGLPSGPALAQASVPYFFVGPDWTIIHAPLWLASVTGDNYAVVLSQRTLQGSRYEWVTGAPAGARGAFGKWNGKTWVDESAFGAGWLAVWIDEPRTIADVSNNGTSGYGFGNGTDELARFQSFTVPTGHPYSLEGLELKVRRLYGTSDPAAQYGMQSDVTVALHRALDGIPVGPAIATALIPSYVIRQEWTVVRVPLRVTLGDPFYAIVLSQRVRSATRYEWVAGASAGVRFGKWTGQSWIDESSAGKGWLRAWLHQGADLQ